MSSAPQPNADHTILFDWDLSEFDRLVSNCGEDDSLNLVLPYLPKNGRILEAGSGPGHVVAYLAARGYDVEGIELNAAIVREVAKLRPDLRLRVDDVIRMNVPDGNYASVLSFGVIEHLKQGPAATLREHHRVLADGGIAMFSVPSLTLVRRVKRSWYFATSPLRPSLNPLLRRMTGRPPARLNRRGRDGFLFDVNPLRGDFFEYVLRPSEFEQLIRDAGFTILASQPTHQAVALWVDFGPWAARNERRLFRPTKLGRMLQSVLNARPFVLNHMHTIIAQKQPSR